MPWRPTEPGEAPTLGWLVLDWMTEYLAQPGQQDYRPFMPTQEQADFLLRFYELDPLTCRRKVRRGVISRPRGWGKSPFTAAIAAAEALGPTYPAGWDADGQPVGMPWSEVRKPLVEIAAVSEDQVATNTWSPLLDMLSHDLILDAYPGLEPMGTFVNLPYGRIQRRTAEARSAKGAPAHFAVCDQTEMWVKSNGGRDLFDTLKNNVTKNAGHLLESPNAYTPGQESVAERSMAAYQAILQGRARNTDGIYFDHREAPATTDLRDGDSLLAGLAIAYGDSADVELCAIHEPPCERPGWVGLEDIRASIWDPDTDVQLARSDWLNQVTHATDSWLSQPDWAARYAGAQDPEPEPLADGDVVTLGFDGSRGRVKGKADATALIGCRVSDGHLFEVGVWEEPDDWPAKADPWSPPEHEVDAKVHATFDRFTVVGFYADPSMWDGHVARWEAKYRARLKVKAGGSGAIRWPKTQMRRVVAALESLHQAVLSGEMTHDGSSDLTRHVLNARRRAGQSGVYIAKDSPSSPNKIDAAYAAMLAWAARLDAIAAGLATPPQSTVLAAPRRIR